MKAKPYQTTKALTQITHEDKESIRINKYLSDASFCSRRDADKYVEEKRVTINDLTVEIGTKVFPNDVVKVDGKIVKRVIKKAYIALNKPIGIVCTNDLNVKNNIRSYVDYKELIYPIGRLDKDSEGLILLTNDGDIVNKILRAEHGHEKEYLVTVNKLVTQEFIKLMSEGVIIYNQVAHKNQKTAPCVVTKHGEFEFKIILKQGLNRQIRRMCEAIGYHVQKLIRLRIMHIKLSDLPVGYWRYLTEQELIELNHVISLKK